MKYEYKFYWINTSSKDSEILQDLNNLGEEGWEVVNITTDPEAKFPMVFLKRVK